MKKEPLKKPVSSKKMSPKLGAASKHLERPKHQATHFMFSDDDDDDDFLTDLSSVEIESFGVDFEEMDEQFDQYC